MIPATRSARCEIPASWRKVTRFKDWFINFLLGTDDFHKWENDRGDEWDVEKQGEGKSGANRGEQPALETVIQSETARGARFLRPESSKLQDEVEGRKPVTALCGDGDHEVMDDARDQKNRECRTGRAQGPSHWTENETKHQEVECAVPTFAPKLSKGMRAQRFTHNRFDRDASPLPKRGKQVEKAEMEDKNHADETDPTGDERLGGNLGRYAPKQDRSSEHLPQSGKDSDAARGAGMRFEKGAGIHSHPQENVGQGNVASAGGGDRPSGCGDGFCNEEQGESEEPHNSPGRDRWRQKKWDAENHDDRYEQCGAEEGLW